MDPLSISASILALLGAARAAVNGLKKLRSIYHASNNLLALFNELSDFQVVLGALSSAITQRADVPLESTLIGQNLAKLIDRAEIVTRKIKETIDACITESEAGPKISRRSWLRRQHSLKLLQEEIRAINQSLSTSLSTAIYSDIRRIELRLEGISVTTEAIRSTQGEHHDLDIHRIQSQQNIVTGTTSQLPPLVTPPLVTPPLVTPPLVTPPLVTPPLITPPVHGGQDSSLGSCIATGNMAEQGKTICVTASHFLSRSCRRDCRCQCHRRAVLQTPRLLERLIGTLFMNYIGIPRQDDACLTNCRRRRGFKARVTYLFPHWFLMKKFSAIITSESGSPHISIRVSRQVSPKSKIFSLCRVGDVEGVKRLFIDGQASPFDVSAQTGSTVLTHAVMGCQSDICDFLINEGADPFAENVFGNRPIDDVLDLILTSQLKREPFEKYFLNGDYYEEKRFSMIHKVATELCPLDMATTLEVSGMSVDIRDVDGRTPLAWAAGRRNLAVVQTLLSYGANPNASDRLKAVPLFAAVKSGTIDTIRLLLTYGADVNTTDHWGNTPLHVAALRGRDIDIALLLLSAGAQINPRDRSGWTPLCAAIFWRRGPMIQLLIEHGADVNNRDNDGMTPLLQAIWLNNHEAISLLLRNKADTSATSKDQRSLLHFAAEFSDVDALKLLATGAQVKLDLEQREIHEKTARAIFNARSDIKLDLVNAFAALLIARNVLRPPSRGSNCSFKSFETAASFISSDVWEDPPDMNETEKLQEKLKPWRKRRFWLSRCTVM